MSDSKVAEEKFEKPNCGHLKTFEFRLIYFIKILRKC